MANVGAKVTISAVDRVSSIVDRINGRLDRMRAPVDRLRSSFGRFASMSGLNALHNGMMRIGRSALGVFRTMGQIVPVLGTITGAASITGVYRLSQAWAQVGTRLGTAARAMGMAPKRLQSMRGAAELAGGSGDAMADALQNLSTTKWEAANGFAPEAAAQFQALGISLKELQTIAPDKMFERIAQRIRAIKDPAARTIAAFQAFGGAAQGLMPILQESEEQYQADIRLANKYGASTERNTAAAQQFNRSFVGLRLASEGFRDSLAMALSPALKDVNDFFAEMINNNREWIAQKAEEYAKRFARWLRNGGWQEIKDRIHGVYDEITSVVDKLGGWMETAKQVAMIGADLWGASVLLRIGQVAKAILSVATSYDTLAASSAAAAAAEGAGGAAAGAGWLGIAGRLVLGLGKRVGLGWAAWEVLHPSYTASNDTISPELRGSLSQDFTKNDGLFGLYARSIAQSEHARYDQMGGSGGAYAGRYQMGRGAITDAARWLNEPVPSQAQFLGDPKMQDRFFRAYTASNQATLFAKSSKFRSLDLAARGGILAYAQNQGAQAAINYMNTGIVGRDGFGTPGTAFSDAFARNLMSAPPVTIPPGNVNGPPPDATRGNVDIVVRHENAPPGSIVRATASGSGLRVSSVTQSRAMSPEISGGGL